MGVACPIFRSRLVDEESMIFLVGIIYYGHPME